jgi:hypothetical protein
VGEPREERSDGEIQFERAEYDAQPAAFACAACQRPVTGEYYEALGKFICPACRDAAESPSGASRRFLVASGLGALAAVVGGLVWYGVRRLTGYEIGLIALGVGFLVGMAVRMGSKGRGGVRYQALAMFLTYSGVALNYAPDIARVLLQHDESQAATANAMATAATSIPVASAEADTAGAKEPARSAPAESAGSGSIARLITAAVIVIGLSYASPFLGGMQNILGLIIIGFALYEAWKLNRRAPVQGPYRTGPAAAEESNVG